MLKVVFFCGICVLYKGLKDNFYCYYCILIISEQHWNICIIFIITFFEHQPLILFLLLLLLYLLFYTFINFVVKSTAAVILTYHIYKSTQPPIKTFLHVIQSVTIIIITTRFVPEFMASSVTNIMFWCPAFRYVEIWSVWGRFYYKDSK